ncbi:helix-turn-helix domain-containing protein [Micromonospora sp. H33]|uniref:helix-turn-helix domain-containing protein n=1 Tax=Micromonospora sp. H33 TaxID=3452215 RepID=UPI003F8AB26D
MSLYGRLSKKPEGARALSGARLRYEVLRVLHSALEKSGMSQSELAGKLGVRKSAVSQVLRGDGNVRISTLADYLHAMNCELELRLVPVGKPREDAVREMRQAWIKNKFVREVPQGSAARRSLEDVQWHEIGRESRAEKTVASKTTSRTTREILLLLEGEC